MTCNYRSITQYRHVFGEPELVTHGAYFQDMPLSVADDGLQMLHNGLEVAVKWLKPTVTKVLRNEMKRRVAIDQAMRIFATMPKFGLVQSRG